MPRNGSGVYTVPNTFVPNTIISSSAVNANFTDVGSALTGSVAADGQTPVVADLQMSTHKHTNVSPTSGAGSRTEYAASGVVQDGGLIDAGLTTGISTAYVATLAPALTAYADKQCFRAKVHVACGANPEINFGPGLKKIYKNVAGVATQLAASEMPASFIPELRYDATLDGAAGGFWLINGLPSAEQVSYDNDASGLNADTVQEAIDALVLPGYLFGLRHSNAADADHDITVSPGEAVDNDNRVLMTLSSAITKQLDATFAEGNNAGGMVSGESLPTSGTVHSWLIMKADGTVDNCYNNYASSGLSPTLPTGFIYKRLIMSLITDSSANIVGFVQTGDLVQRKVPVNLFGPTSPGTTSAVLTSIGVPSGIKCTAIFAHATTLASNPFQALYTDPDTTDMAPSSGVFSVYGMQSGVGANGIESGQQQIMTNTSGQIRRRYSSGSVSETFTALGWIQHRNLT